MSHSSTGRQKSVGGLITVSSTISAPSTGEPCAVRSTSRNLCLVVVLVCTAMLLLGGCAGSGEGLDENGNPIGVGGIPPEDELPPPGGEVSVSFSRDVQESILVRFCDCHQGANPPQGLVLNTGATWGMLVDIRSNEVPGLFRVEEFNPDDSYLVRKIEGGPDIVDGRMPLGRAPLTLEQIDTIRQWIAEGALSN